MADVRILVGKKNMQNPLHNLLYIHWFICILLEICRKDIFSGSGLCVDSHSVVPVCGVISHQPVLGWFDDMISTWFLHIKIKPTYNISYTTKHLQVYTQMESLKNDPLLNHPGWRLVWRYPPWRRKWTDARLYLIDPRFFWGENLWTYAKNPIGMADHSLFTLLGTNISPEMSVLKMIFLFPRWDMLISWRVFQFVDWFFFKSSFVLYNVKVLRVGLQVRIITLDHNRLAVQWLVGGLGWCPVLWIPNESSYERDCYLRVPLESQTTGAPNSKNLQHSWYTVPSCWWFRNPAPVELGSLYHSCPGVLAPSHVVIVISCIRPKRFSS